MRCVAVCKRVVIVVGNYLRVGIVIASPVRARRHPDQSRWSRQRAESNNCYVRVRHPNGNAGVVSGVEGTLAMYATYQDALPVTG